MTALASSRNDRYEALRNSRCRDITGVILSVARNRFCYHIGSAATGAGHSARFRKLTSPVER
jgi:hypothetical protein